MMVDIVSELLGLVVILDVVLFVTVLDLRCDKEQLQWERNFYYECYHEYMSKYVDVYQELRKLKEKEGLK